MSLKGGIADLSLRDDLLDGALEVQVKKALRKGYILTDLTTCLASGAPGSGKTNLRYLLYQLKPPDVRISTACIEEVQRAIISSHDSENHEVSKWKPVHSGELKEIVAKGVSAGVEGTEDQLPPLRAHWVHYIESGGQPQFLEVLAAFVHNISLLILLIKLSEELSAPPSVEYFSPDGKSHELGLFPLSNEQLLVQAAQLSLFHRSQVSLPHVKTVLSQMKTVIVGTFKDQEHKCKESRGEKNSQLKQILMPFKQQLIPRSESEIIFPINAKSAGQGDNEDPVASELRSAIEKFAPQLTMLLPLQWYSLETELRKLGLKIITRRECWEIAMKLGFDSEEELEAALLYLHEANLFLYYPDVLSNTIFVGSNAVISNITQLFEHHVGLEDTPEAEIVEEDNLRYRDQAVFTASTLQSLDTDYSKEAFPNDDLVKLLQHRLVVAEMPFLINDETAYMMPSLLSALEEGEIVRPKTTSASPLLVTFPEGWAPIGLFCATTVSLLSGKTHFPWKITEFVSGKISKLYKNYLIFSIGFIAGSITLVNTMKQFEVHPSSTFPTDFLPLIWQSIDRALKEACSKYSYKASHQFAFTCTCAVPSHAALISTEKSTTQCTRDSKVEPLSVKQRPWVQLQNYAKVEVNDQQIQTEIKTEHKGVQVGSMTKQQEVQQQMLQEMNLNLPTAEETLQDNNDLKSRPLIIRQLKETDTVLGVGAFGCVVEVEVEGKLFAAKRFHPTRKDEIFCKKFSRECALLVELNHPNIVCYRGIHFPPREPLPLLVMERLVIDLHSYLLDEQNSKLPICFKATILCDIAKGLAYLHARQPVVIHRDLTAKNILLNSEGVAKIADFGNSRIIDISPDSGLEIMSGHPGTVVYLPPEALCTEAKYNAKIDVFSFGHLALFVAIQTFPKDLKPFNYTDDQGDLRALTEVERRAQYIGDMYSKLGKDHHLVTLIKCCLCNNLKERPSANRLVRELEEMLGEREQFRRTISTNSIKDQPDGKPRPYMKINSSSPDIN